MLTPDHNHHLRSNGEVPGLSDKAKDGLAPPNAYHSGGRGAS